MTAVSPFSTISLVFTVRSVEPWTGSVGALLGVRRATCKSSSSVLSLVICGLTLNESRDCVVRDDDSVVLLVPGDDGYAAS